MSKRYRRPKHIICYDNDVIILTNLNSHNIYFIKDNLLNKSDKLPTLGNKIGFFDLSDEIKDQVVLIYNKVWNHKRNLNK